MLRLLKQLMDTLSTTKTFEESKANHSVTERKEGMVQHNLTTLHQHYELEKPGYQG